MRFINSAMICIPMLPATDQMGATASVSVGWMKMIECWQCAGTPTGAYGPAQREAAAGPVVRMQVRFRRCAGHVLPCQKGASPTLSESAWAEGNN